jgi:RimJ/RimL family protein N-acetyltransferase
MRLRQRVQHNISLTCVRYRLRPVTLEDASFIVALRTDPLLNRFLHEISPRVEDQVAWLECYFLRPDDYYFIVEDANSGKPHGAIGIYDVAENAAGAEWGRWVLKRGSMAALESAWLIYEVGFSRLRLASLTSRTLAENPRVVSFHESFGASRVAVLDQHFLVRGNLKSAIEHRVKATEWPVLRARHYSTVSRLACRAFQ